MLNQPIVTYVLLGLTILTSIPAMSDLSMKGKLLFFPYGMKREGEWHRFITHGFVHADWMHLIINMYVLYIFGGSVEMAFTSLYGKLGPLLFLLMYIMAIPIAATFSFFKHQNDYAYRSLGASGAVSAVVFAYILLAPLNNLYFLFLPFIPIPAVVMGVGYLVYSQYMSKRGGDNVEHNAHFYGALFGFIFPILFEPLLLTNFIDQILSYF